MKKALFITLSAYLAFVLYACTSNKCDDCEALGITIPEFEDNFSRKRVTLDSDYIMEGHFFTMNFSSMEEAEFKIANCIIGDERPSYIYSGADFYMTQQVILSDKSSMTYPFSLMQEILDFDVLDSDDGKVRFYGWHHIDGGNGYNPYLMVQYRDEKGNVHVLRSEDFEKPMIAPEDEYGLFPKTVYDFEYEGANYYLLSGYYGFDCGISSYGLIAFRLDKKGLHPIKIFHGKDYEQSINVDFCYSDWNEEVLGGDACIHFDKDNAILYIPEVIDYSTDEQDYSCSELLTDRFFKYVWDGKSFVLRDDRTYADPYLFHSLSNYKRIVHLLNTKRNKVRIDLMPDGTYRYAAWKAGQAMSEKPELIILGGSYYGGVYVFQNEGYIYHVDDDGIKVTKSGKVVGEWGSYYE